MHTAIGPDRAAYQADVSTEVELVMQDAATQVNIIILKRDQIKNFSFHKERFRSQT